jgi:hypothetical protein
LRGRASEENKGTRDALLRHVERAGTRNWTIGVASATPTSRFERLTS